MFYDTVPGTYYIFSKLWLLIEWKYINKKPIQDFASGSFVSCVAVDLVQICDYSREVNNLSGKLF